MNYIIKLKGLIGSFCSPYVLALSNALSVNPYLLIALISITGPFGAMLIRETYRMKLIDHISEEEEKVKQDKV